MAALCAVLLLPAAAPAAAGDTETILVLDASRSMWGEIRNQHKIAMVLEALANALRNDERIIPGIGLISFGDRSPSRCSDFSVHLGAGRADRRRFLDAVGSIRPLGATPLAGALALAADQFSDDAQSRRLVVLSDGIDNCGGDPCATAADLKRRLPGLTIDVIALGVADAEHELLSCMASETSGLFIAASSQAELDRAGRTIIDRVVTESRSPTRDIVAAAADPAEADDPAVVRMREFPLPEPNPRTYVRDLARIEVRERPAPSDPDASPQDDPQRVAEALQALLPTTAETTPEPETSEPDIPGPRISEPQVSEPQVPEPQVPEADPITTASIPDDAVDEVPETAPAPDRTPLTLALRNAEPDAEAAPSPEHEPELDIRNAPAPQSQGIRLSAKLAAEMRQIGMPVDWTVYKVEDTDQALWQQVAAVRAPDPTFTLDPGTYLVRARYGYVAASKMVDVSEGRLTDATFVLNAGGLRILSHLVFVDAPEGTSATHYVYTGETDENGMRQLITKSDTQGEIIRLNAGRYRVISRLGDANSVVSTDVEVSPGVLTAVEVNHKAAVLSFEVASLQDTEDGLATNLVVFDTEGRLVVRLRGETTNALLAPGHYLVTAERAGRKVTREIDVRIGEARTVSLELK